MAKAKASQSPAPFLKWVGGKRQLLAEIERLAPKQYGRYFEPFLGGGSVLFSFVPHSPVINDINPHLTNAYLQIKNNPQNLLSEIKKIDSVPCDKEYYYSIRDRYNKKIIDNQLDEECAALMIWLNKHCFTMLQILTKQLSTRMFSIWYKSNYNDVPVCAEVSEITARFVQNWFAETVVRFMAIRSSTPRKNIVRMYGIAIDVTRAATTAPRRFFLRTIWLNTTFRHCLRF